jgi:hypothetical protein
LPSASDDSRPCGLIPQPSRITRMTGRAIFQCSALELLGEQPANLQAGAHRLVAPFAADFFRRRYSFRRRRFSTLLCCLPIMLALRAEIVDVNRWLRVAGSDRKHSYDASATPNSQLVIVTLPRSPLRSVPDSLCSSTPDGIVLASGPDH